MRISPTIRRPYKWALLIALVMLGIWVFPFPHQSRGVNPPKLTAAFLGYTNIAPGMSAAIFGITNRSQSSVKLWNCQIDIEGATIPLNSTVRFVETYLEPGKGFITLAGLPPRRAKWRAGWGYSETRLNGRLIVRLKKICPWQAILDWAMPREFYLLEGEWFSP